MPVFGKSRIGNSCFIDPDALIGYPHNDELDKDRDDIEGCSIGANSTIRPGSVYSTAKIGKNTRTGHNYLIRENTVVGDGCLIGTNVVIDNACVVGDNCSFQTGAYIPTGTRIGNRVFLGPHASLTNDRKESGTG